MTSTPSTANQQDRGLRIGRNFDRAQVEIRKGPLGQESMNHLIIQYQYQVMARAGRHVPETVARRVSVAWCRNLA
jgi:hypothetical protein